MRLPMVSEASWKPSKEIPKAKPSRWFLSSPVIFEAHTLSARDAFVFLGT